MHIVDLVLRKSSHGDDLFDEVASAVEALNMRAIGFELDEDEEVADGTVNTVWTWEVDDELFGRLALVEYSDCAVSFVSVMMAKMGDLRRVVAVLEEHLDIPSLGELKRAAHPKLLMDPLSLFELGIASSSLSRPDSDVVELIDRGLEHRDPQVRYYAACAAHITGWPVLLPSLEQLLKTETVSRVEAMATEAILVCQRL